MAKNPTRLEKLSSYVNEALESFFYFWGSSIALKPFSFIGGCLLFTCICSLGFFNFYREGRPERLWIPNDSRFYNTSVWLMSNFPPPVRQQFVIITANDVLQPKIMQKMLKIHNKIRDLKSSMGTNWEDHCFKFPVIKMSDGSDHLLKKFRNRVLMKREIGDESSTTISTSTNSPELAALMTDDFFDDFGEGLTFEVQSTTTKSPVTKKARHSQHNGHHNHNNGNGKGESQDKSKPSHHHTSHGGKQTSQSNDEHSQHHSQSNIDHSKHSPKEHAKYVSDNKIAKDFADFDSEFRGETFRNVITNETDLSVSMPRNLYCGAIDAIPKACWEYNILELWNYDDFIVNNLTKKDICDALYNVKISPVFGTPADYAPLLGDIEFDSNGRIISAKALMTIWHVEVNQSLVRRSVQDLLDMGLSDPADEETLAWESDFLKQLEEESDVGMDVLRRAWRSVPDMTTESVRGGICVAIMGYGAMCIYIVIMFSELNIVQLRILSASMGIVAIFLSSISTVGICSTFGIMFGPLHPNLLVLLLGLGVDDMFVIMQCWNMLSESDTTRPLHEKMGLTLKHAGVSITVTSLTNFMAFAVSATSCLPNVYSFCLYVAVGIIIVYIFQATFFVAFLVIDQKRMEEKKNPIFVCYKHKSFKVIKNSPRQIVQNCFDDVAPYLTKIPVKITIIITTLSFLGFGLYGLCHIQQKMDPTWVLPTNNYLSDFIRVLLSKYKIHGEEAIFILSNVNYTADMNVIDEFVKEIRSHDDIIADVEDWYTDFKNYVNSNYNEDVPNSPIPEVKFHEYLSKFLFSPAGAQHQKSFRFFGELKCTDVAPPFEVSLFPFRFRGFGQGTYDHIYAMQRTRAIVDGVTFSQPGSWVSVWCYAFYLWENEEIILPETVRNMGLASLCVFVSTLIVLANFKISILVMGCVFMTLVDVLGFMHFWDLQINTVTSIVLVLAIGMSVDFAAHIGHAFLVADGTKNQRAEHAFRTIGPAVYNGGFSTLLAFAFLIYAGSYVLYVFFQLFLLVVVFGIFNGMLFLPVLLSLIGPSPYLHTTGKMKDVASKPITNGVNEHEFIVIKGSGDTVSNGNSTRHKDVISLPEENKKLYEDPVVNGECQD